MTTTEQAQIVEAVAGNQITDEMRAANRDEVARQANATTAVYGLTGAGKSALADTACEYCFETFRKITLCYAIDPAGWGNKRLSLIRLGLMKVWDPSNHVNNFETMEAMSLGAWPETILDTDRGYADPTVKLILPRRLAFVLTCPQGHDVQSFDNEAVMNASNINCPTCGVIANISNTQGVKRAIVKSKLFHNVGLRIFDSVSGMNDRGLIIELPLMSAKGTIATNKDGGGALASADALRQGTVVYGTGSKAQVGFMQNRSYQWLVNIRSIPDQVVPSIAIFGVEQTTVDDEGGGEMVLGPKIAGNKRTYAVGGWVGNLLHASREPLDGTTVDPVTGAPAMVHRLWLANHVDPRRTDKVPYLAKHRGTPLDMPDYLQDPWDADPEKRAAGAWSKCSLNHFFKLLESQFVKVQAADKAKFPDAPALVPQSPAVDEIIPVAAGAVVTGVTVSAGTVPAGEGAGAPAVSGGRTLRSRSRMVATALPVVPVAPPAPAAPTNQPATATPAPAASTPTPQAVTPVATVAAPTGSGVGTADPTAIPPPAAPVTPVAPETPSVIQQQLEASLAQRTGAAGAVTGTPVTVASPGVSNSPAPALSTASIAPAASGPRVIRRPRPPV
jgi:hypothetical protein